MESKQGSLAQVCVMLVCVEKRIVNKILNVGDRFPVPTYLEFVMFMFHIKKGR